MVSMVNQLANGDNSNRANAAFMLGLFTILAALTFEHVGGYVPCELCHGQRTPYYVALPLLALIILAWKRIPAPPRIALTAIVAALFLWSTYLAGFHSGVEWGWWQGPTSCSGAQEMSFDDLGALNDTEFVPCNIVQFRLFGLSFAGWNALISAIISGLLIWSVLGQIKRTRSERKPA